MSVARGLLVERRGARVPGRLLPRGVVRRRRVAARLACFGVGLTVLRTVALVVALALLPLFSASGECCVAMPRPRVWAENGVAIEEGPWVVVAPWGVRVDGVAVADEEEMGRRSGRVDGLFENLEGKRRLWQSLRQERAYPGVCQLQIGPWIPAFVVRRVLLTVAEAGCRDAGFVVNHYSRGRLDE